MALAWLLAQGDDIAPILGTKRVEENTAADGIELSADQLAKLDNLTPAAGSRQQPQRGGQAAPGTLISPIRCPAPRLAGWLVIPARVAAP
ncbi:hypothetical protein [Streptomyces sp. NBC_01314]|uniref:hypothetical protein n=1 Tax=Streptomyces sp. NBC_01314 TaxID=2903821 RepID=UPI00352E6820